MTMKLNEYHEEVKMNIINHLMEIGVYKINDRQLYQVPLCILIIEYKRHLH